MPECQETANRRELCAHHSLTKVALLYFCAVYGETALYQSSYSTAAELEIDIVITEEIEH